MSLPFVLPPLTVNGVTPIWQGNHFQVGNEFTSVLQYSSNEQGWNDELTFFHEESAGDQHFIDKASRDHAILQLQTHLPHQKAIILEVGCSSGFMLQRMHQTFPDATIMGSDIVSAPLQKLAKTLPSTPLFRFDLTHCPLPDASVDAVVLLNVLEHIERDDLALKQIYRILKPGGVLVVEVPAGPHLYDIYDKVLMHYRRYTLSHLRELALKEGFKIAYQSHLGFFLYPGFWWVKKRNQRLKSETEAAQKELVEQSIRRTGENKLLHALMQTELCLGQFLRYPVGIRCLITCKK